MLVDLVKLDAHRHTDQSGSKPFLKCCAGNAAVTRLQGLHTWNLCGANTAHVQAWHKRLKLRGRNVADSEATSNNRSNIFLINDLCKRKGQLCASTRQVRHRFSRPELHQSLSAEQLEPKTSTEPIIIINKALLYALSAARMPTKQLAAAPRNVMCPRRGKV